MKKSDIDKVRKTFGVKDNKDGEKYGGNYVATRSFKDRSIVSYGTDPIKVFDEAIKKGVKDPVVIYVPKKGMVHIY